MPPYQRITSTTTWSQSCASIAARIGRPAVPPGSPSSLLRYWSPSFQAQQLCEAFKSLCCSMNAWASAGLLIGPANVMKRLLRISSRYSQKPLRVKGIKDLDSRCQAAALEDDADQVGAGVFHVLLGQLGAPADTANLGGEVGVMLSAAPQQEDQVYRVDRVHLAGVDPRLEHCGPALEPGAIVLVEILGQALAAADHFHGENPRGLWLASGELHLRADVTGQRLGRIVFGGQGVERAVPQLDDVAQYRHVQPKLVGEVVMQVRFGQPGILGDGVHAGAFEPVAGEFIFGGFEDRLFVLLTNAAGRFAAVGGDFKGHRHFRNSLWVQPVR